MLPYGNLTGNTGVRAYETGPDFIWVQFTSGETYLYTYESAGDSVVEEMKALAMAGRGLSTYISRTVKDHYALKA